MTEEEIKKSGIENTIPAQRDELEAELSALIADEKSGLGDLAKFSKNLSHEKKQPLSKKHLKQIKADLQNGGLIEFE
jgi:hypothetical protein